MENYLLISDAAREVQVESHVLRYWEEELQLPIRRNELGHRYYTKEDVERFKQIKSMKERGLQLKAIKMILKDGKLDVMLSEKEKQDVREQEMKEKADMRASGMAIDIIERKCVPAVQETSVNSDREEKAKRLQWLLQQMIRETIQENNKELCRDIKDSVIKELDYQFRVQEEREDERARLREEREELHYQKLDELLRKKSRGLSRAEEKNRLLGGSMKKKDDKKEKQPEDAPAQLDVIPAQKDKRKRHFM